jgi:hypothetical protein
MKWKRELRKEPIPESELFQLIKLAYDKLKEFVILPRLFDTSAGTLR